MIKHTLLIPAALLALTAGNVALADVSMGKSLHEANCVACHMVTHDDAFYEARINGQSDRGIDNLQSLRTMVQGCATNFSLDWFDDEVNAVADYLNATYYKFD
ncbi:MAG: cytochrome c [Halothiobacillaceae bacterium]